MTRRRSTFVPPPRRTLADVTAHLDEVDCTRTYVRPTVNASQYRPIVEVNPYQLRPSRHDSGWAVFTLSCVAIVLMVVGAVVL